MSIPISRHMEPMNPSLIREIFKAAQKEGMISFAAGSPSASEYPVGELKAVAKDVFENQAVTALSYGVTEGYDPLKAWIRQDLEAAGMCSGKDGVLITSGGQQILDLTAKCLIDDGDTILVEAPTFLNALNTFRTYGAHLVGVPMDEEGMRMDALEEALKTESRVKLIYTIPNFQNPMGVTMTEERRRALYRLAEQYDVMILEDDPYGKLRYSGKAVSAVKTMDEGERVIYASSFSKTIAPGIRVAYLSAPQELVDKMVVAKQCVDVHTNMLSQLVVYGYLTHYDLEAHIKECCVHYRVKRDAMLSAIEREFPASVQVTHPEGGLFLWVTLPEGYTGLEFCDYASSVGVAAVPGAPFFADCDPKDRGFRLNFSVPTVEQIETGIARMGEGLKTFIK